MATLDLENLSVEQKILLDKTAVDIRDDYNTLISSLSEGYNDDLDWKLGSIASRNPYLSPLFISCCRLALVDAVLAHGDSIDKILVPSKALCSILKQKISDTSIEVECTESRRSRTVRRLSPIKDGLASILRLATRYSASRFKKHTYTFEDPLVLLDTFILRGEASGGIKDRDYKDRYYPGLLEHVDDQVRSSIYYLPSFIGIINYIPAFRRARKARQAILIKDDFLRIKDYWYAFWHINRIRKYKHTKAVFREYNVIELVRKEKWNTAYAYSTLVGLLNYRFAYRFSRESVRVQTLVEWYENQVIDRGMISGFRNYWPETRIIGYQGFYIAANHQIHIHPTEVESRQGVVPHRIGVVGEAARDLVCEFYKDLDVFVAPAFRFQKVYRKPLHQPDSTVFTILVALPIVFEDASHILQLVTACESNLRGQNVRFWIKPHPNLDIKSITSALDSQRTEKVLEVAIETGDFADYVEQADLLIGMGSSTCVEALAKGLACIIVSNNNSITQNTIPDGIDDSMWCIIYDHEMMLDRILHFKEYMLQESKATRCKRAAWIRENYFYPVTKTTVHEFLFK